MKTSCASRRLCGESSSCEHAHFTYRFRARAKRADLPGRWKSRPARVPRIVALSLEAHSLAVSKVAHAGRVEALSKKSKKLAGVARRARPIKMLTWLSNQSDGHISRCGRHPRRRSTIRSPRNRRNGNRSRRRNDNRNRGSRNHRNGSPKPFVARRRPTPCRTGGMWRGSRRRSLPRPARLPETVRNSISVAHLRQSWLLRRRFPQVQRSDPQRPTPARRL